MGLFLSLSGLPVDSRKATEAIQKAMESSGRAGLKYACHESESGYTTVIYGDEFYAGSEFSCELSALLKLPVLYFHIHDGDLWMYELYAEGRIADQFNPLPDYWEELSSDERLKWQGDADAIAAVWPRAKVGTIGEYLKCWDDTPEGTRACPDDEYENHDCWQVVDFMSKVGLAYPPDSGPLFDELPKEDDDSVPEPDRRNYNGVTPLVSVVANGRVDEVLDLISAGANVDKPTSNGDTPLHTAMTLPTRDDAEAFSSIVGILLSKGANPSPKDEYSRTPLHLAADLGNLAIAKQLINAGADTNAATGYSPLMHAALKGDVKMVNLLIGSGTDVGYKATDGADALSCAKKSGKKAVVDSVARALAQK